MLGTVVLEDAVDLLHLRDGGHVAQENGDLEQRFQNDLAPAAQRHQMVHTAHQNRGQHREEQDREQAADEGSRPQQHVLRLFAEVVSHPFFKGGLLLFGVVVVAHAHLCGVHHVPVAHDETFHH